MREDVRPVTIFHNPGCGTSNKVLAAIRERGIEPEVVRYLERGWTRASLRRVLDALGLGPREVLRSGTPEGAVIAERDEAAIFDALLADPSLVERPIVVTARGAAVCRPADRVLRLL